MISVAEFPGCTLLLHHFLDSRHNSQNSSPFFKQWHMVARIGQTSSVFVSSRIHLGPAPLGCTILQSCSRKSFNYGITIFHLKGYGDIICILWIFISFTYITSEFWFNQRIHRKLIDKTSLKLLLVTKCKFSFKITSPYYGNIFHHATINCVWVKCLNFVGGILCVCLSEGVLHQCTESAIYMTCSQ